MYLYHNRVHSWVKLICHHMVLLVDLGSFCYFFSNIVAGRCCYCRCLVFSSLPIFLSPSCIVTIVIITKSSGITIIPIFEINIEIIMLSLTKSSGRLIKPKTHSHLCHRPPHIHLSNKYFNQFDGQYFQHDLGHE